jgi:hypothetical protein
VIGEFAAVVVDPMDEDKVRIYKKGRQTASGFLKRNRRTHLASAHPSSAPRPDKSPNPSAPRSGRPARPCARVYPESAAPQEISGRPSCPMCGRQTAVDAATARRASVVPTAKGSSSTTLGLRAVSRASERALIRSEGFGMKQEEGERESEWTVGAAGWDL